MADETELSEAQRRLDESEIRKRRVLLGLPEASEIRKKIARLATEAALLLKQAENSIDDFDREYLSRLTVIDDIHTLGEYVEHSTELIDGLQKILTDMRDTMNELSTMFKEEVSTNLELEAEALKSIGDYLKRWS